MNSVITETTKHNDNTEIILHDGTCAICTALAGWFKRPLRQRGYVFVPLQQPWAATFLEVQGPELLKEMKVILRSGEIKGGANALTYLAGRYWWAMPVKFIERFQRGSIFLQRLYQWIARHRFCRADACRLPRRSMRLGVCITLLSLPFAAAFVRSSAPAWAVMWLLAAFIFAFCKWLTWQNTREKLPQIRPARLVGYFCFWPGMDALAFLDPLGGAPKPLPRDWLFAGLKTGLGLATLWGVTRLALPFHPILAGWIGMLGIIFTLHFGAFHLLALWWRARSVKADPIMRFPARAVSVGEFWGIRWNRGFNNLAHHYIFHPLQPRFGTTLATLAAFLTSGIVHELVISFPARGGYGLPSLYFLFQALGVLIQRSAFGKRFRLRRGRRGWLFTAAITAGPAFWLFHPLFVKRVILPFLEAIGVL